MLYIFFLGYFCDRVIDNTNIKFIYCFGIIGFIDDFLSLKKKGNEGLTTYQKLFMQVIISVAFFYIYMKNGGQTSFTVGTLHIDIELGWLYGLFILFVLFKIIYTKIARPIATNIPALICDPSKILSNPSFAVATPFSVVL